MIPKVIHYCWFGKNDLPEMAKKCIDSWRKYLPEYEIKEWNEDNFDVNCCDYVKEAYQAKKWAFVSDYARFKILYENGGVYFDTDVEVIKTIDDIIENGPFMGCEMNTQINFSGKCTTIKVNPGLGIAAEPYMNFYKEVIDYYNSHHFRKEDGSLDTTTIVEYTTDLLESHGYVANNEIQDVAKIRIYPVDYFCPLDYCTGVMKQTGNTRTIHWFSSTWFSQGQHMQKKIMRITSRLGRGGYIIEKVISFPVKAMNKVQELGLKNSVVFFIKKIVNRD